MTDFERYGTVKTNLSGKVIAFEEKSYKKEGVINGGIYIVKKSILQEIRFPVKFSFEKEFLEPYYNKLNFIGFESDAYFLDIGIPEDYDQPQIDFSTKF